MDKTTDRTQQRRNNNIKRHEQIIQAKNSIKLILKQKIFCKQI